MRTERKHIELAAFFLIFAMAVFLRFFNLGRLPLGDAEALTALQALQLSKGLAPQPVGDVLLTNLIAGWMFLFGNAAWGARLFSALAGSMLVFLPFLFRRHINSTVLIVVAFWIAIDPGFLAMSRQINSTELAILISGFAFVAFLERKSILVGLWGALLLLTGSTFWFGLIPLALSFALLYLRIPSGIANRVDLIEKLNWLDRRKFLISFLFTLTLAGTFGLIYLSQFGGIVSGFLALFNFPHEGYRPGFGAIIRMLLLYQLPLLFFGLAGLFMIRKKSGRLFPPLVLYIVLVIFELAFLPTISVAFVLWLEIPFLILAAAFLVRALKLPDDDFNSITLVSGIGIAVFGFLILIANNLFNGALNTSQTPVSKEFLIIAGGILVLIAIFLIGWSLSWRVAGKSLLVIGVFYSLLFTLSAGWNASGLRTPSANEMWALSQMPKDSDLLLETIREYSLWSNGNETDAEILVISFDSPSLEWELRNFENARFEKNSFSLSNPEMIITPANQQIEMLESYRGQDFSYYTRPNWTVLIFREWHDWILTRQIPANMIDRTPVILWVRNDLFPGT